MRISAHSVMALTEVLFFFDYVDPASWAVELWLSELGEPGAAVARRPFEVRPPPAPLSTPGDPRWTAAREWVGPALEAAGHPLPEPTLVPWTRKAIELALHARERGRFGVVHAALFEAFHARGADIGRVDVLVGIASAAGLDATETKAVLDVDRFTAEVEAVRAEAERLEVRGVPTLLAGQARLERPAGIDELRSFLTSHGSGR